MVWHVKLFLRFLLVFVVRWVITQIKWVVFVGVIVPYRWALGGGA